MMLAYAWSKYQFLLLCALIPNIILLVNNMETEKDNQESAQQSLESSASSFKSKSKRKFPMSINTSS